MMIRHVWLLTGFTLALLAATQASDIIPDILDGMTPGLLSSTYTTLFYEDAFVRIASFLTVGGTVLFLLVFEGLATFDAVALMFVQRTLREERILGSGVLEPEAFTQIITRQTPFEDQVAAYTNHIHPHTGQAEKSARKNIRYTATVSSRSYFGAKRTVDPLLYKWLFDPLPLLLFGTGVVLASLTLVWGLNQTGETVIGDALRPGIIAFAMLFGAALMIMVLKQATLALRRQQAENLCHEIDLLYPPAPRGRGPGETKSISQDASKAIATAISKLSNDLNHTINAKLKDWLKAAQNSNDNLEKHIVAGLEEALREPMRNLTEAAKGASREQAEQSRAALEAVLDAFLKGLEKHFSGQMKQLTATLEKADQAAQSLEESYRQSLTVQHEQISEGLAAYSENFRQTASNFEALQSVVENLITLVSPMLRQVIDNQESLLNALEQESSASKVIGRAAAELSAAAKASRDTVERFITLAERLRETSKAMAGTRSGTAAAVDKQLIKELRALKNDVLENVSPSE